MELLRQLGFTYKKMESEDECRIAVVDVKCRFKAPALYDDEIVIRTHLKNVRDSLIHFGYEVLRASDRTLLAEGETTHIVVGHDMQKKALPEKYLVPLGMGSQESVVSSQGEIDSAVLRLINYSVPPN